MFLPTAQSFSREYLFQNHNLYNTRYSSPGIGLLLFLKAEEFPAGSHAQMVLLQADLNRQYKPCPDNSEPVPLSPQ